MTQSFSENSGMKTLYGMLVPCGTCSYCKSISIREDNIVVVDCWNIDQVIFQIKPNRTPKCPCQEIRDLVPNFEIN